MTTKVRLHVPPETLDRAEFEITGDSYRYLARARRLAIGDTLIVFDGNQRQAQATITAATKSSMTLRRDDLEEVIENRPRVTVLLSTIKNQRMTWAVQKLAELGVTEIVPVQAERSVATWADNEIDKRQHRYQEVAIQATRQARGTHVTQITRPLPLAQALEQSQAPLRLLMWEGSNISLGERLNRGHDSNTSYSLCIGPEGGFTADEVSLAHDAGFVDFGLPGRILRAETAAIVAATLVLYDNRHPQATPLRTP